MAAIESLLLDAQAHGLPATRSLLESEFIEFCLRYGLPRPQVNRYDGTQEVDFRWPAAGVVVETDGWQFHRSRASFERDALRTQRLASEGWTVIRITWRQLRRDPDGVALRLPAPHCRFQVGFRPEVDNGSRAKVSTMSSDAPPLIETAVKRVLEEVPALKPMKLAVAIELHGRGDIQQFRLELPEVNVVKGLSGDERVNLELRRDFFNLMVEHEAKVADWEQALHEGRLKASGMRQYLQLVGKVVEKQQERNRLKRAHG